MITAPRWGSLTPLITEVLCRCSPTAAKNAARHATRRCPKINSDQELATGLTWPRAAQGRPVGVDGRTGEGDERLPEAHPLRVRAL